MSEFTGLEPFMAAVEAGARIEIYDPSPAGRLRYALAEFGARVLAARACPGSSCLLNSMDHQHIGNRRPTR